MRKLFFLGQTYITELLLKHGANPHLKTNDGLTARDLAQLKGRMLQFKI